MTLTDPVKDAVSKAPQVTLAFWLEAMRSP